MAASAEARARILFVLFLLVLAAGGLGWWLWAAGSHATYEIRSSEPVSGLIAGAPVEFHGVEVGTVDRVELAGPRAVRILVSLRKDTPVSSATVATVTGRGLAARGFTGYVYVNLEEGPAGGPPLRALAGQPYPVIAAAPTQLVSIDTAVHKMNQDVASVAALLRTTLDPQTVSSLKQSLVGLEQVTRSLAANTARIDAVLANAEKATAQMQPLLQSSQATVRTVQTQLLPQASSFLTNAERASARMEPLLLSSQDAVWSLQFQVLPGAERAMSRVDRLSSDLDATVVRIRRDPSLLLRGSVAAPGPGETP